MSRKVECLIVVTEQDGRLSITGKIPDGAEQTIAGCLALYLMDHAAVRMNATLEQNQRVEEYTSQ